MVTGKLPQFPHVQRGKSHSILALPAGYRVREENMLGCESAVGQKRIKKNMQTGDGKIGWVAQDLTDEISELGGARRIDRVPAFLLTVV